MKQGTIAGPYDPLYPEVATKLGEEIKSYSARWVYIALVALYPVLEDWEADDPVWVSGVITASKTDIAKVSGVGRKGFFRLWEQLVEAGLVEERADGRILIKYYKKRAYDSISAREVRERFARVEETLREIAPSAKGENPQEAGADQEEIKTEEEVSPGAAAGSRQWIVDKLNNLWPGRGSRPESDAEYMDALEGYSAPELQAAFDRARKDKARYGNFEYILNFLRNPLMYEKKGRKGRGAKPKTGEEDASHYGTLNVDWLDEV